MILTRELEQHQKKLRDDVMTEHGEVIVIFPVYG